MDFKIFLKRLVILFLFSVLLSGCGGGFTRIPDMDSDNAELYILRCSVCHSLPHPKRHTYRQWIHIVDLMNGRMEKMKIRILDNVEKESILEYLSKNAR